MWWIRNAKRSNIYLSELSCVCCRIARAKFTDIVTGKNAAVLLSIFCHNKLLTFKYGVFESLFLVSCVLKAPVSQHGNRLLFPRHLPLFILFLACLKRHDTHQAPVAGEMHVLGNGMFFFKVLFILWGNYRRQRLSRISAVGRSPRQGDGGVWRVPDRIGIAAE